MSDVAKRNNRNRTAGAAWERRIEQDGRAAFIDTERTRNSGVQDQGDLVMRINGRYHVIEAKNVARVNMTDFVRQANEEAIVFAARRGIDVDRVHPVAFIKKQGAASALEGFALMSVAEYLRLAGTASL